MGYIHCCAGLRKAKTYSISPEENYLLAQIDYLEKCPVCGHTVIQLTRINIDNEISICRRVNEKAKKMLDKLQSSILYEKTTTNPISKGGSKFYLYYNEYGAKKKCFSNLSAMKLGLFENY